VGSLSRAGVATPARVAKAKAGVAKPKKGEDERPDEPTLF